MSPTLVCLLLLGAPPPAQAAPAAARPGIFRITPLRPVDELRREALAAQPPAEPGPFRPVDLVELTTLDATIQPRHPLRDERQLPGRAGLPAGARLPAAARGRGASCARTARSRRRASAC